LALSVEDTLVTVEAPELTGPDVSHDVFVWSTRTHAQRLVLGGHGALVEDVAASAGALFVTSSADAELRVWDFCSGACLSRHRLDAPAAAVRFVTAHVVRALLVSGAFVDVNLGEDEQREIGRLGEALRCATASPDGRVWVAAARDRAVLHVVRGEEICVVELGAGSGCVSSLALEVQAGRIVVGDEAGGVELIELGSLRTFGRSTVGVEPVTVVHWLPRHHLVALAFGAGPSRTFALDRRVLLWDHDRCEIVAAARGHSDDVRAMALLDEERQLVSIGRDGAVLEWDIAGLVAGGIERVAGLYVNDVALVGREQFVAADDDGSVTMYTLDEGSPLWRVPCLDDPAIWVIALEAGERCLAVSHRGDAALVDMRTHAVVKHWTAWLDVDGVCRANDDTILLTGAPHRGAAGDVVACRFQPLSGAQRTFRLAGTAPMLERFLSVSEASQIIVGMRDEDQVAVWDLETGVELRRAPRFPAGVRAIAMSCEGAAVFVVTSNGHLWRWNPLADGDPIAISDEFAAVRAIEVSPDGLSCVTSADEGRISVWELAGPRRLGSWFGWSWAHSIAVRWCERIIVAGMASGDVAVLGVENVDWLGSPRVAPP
jgi:WD40 repeat protein